MTNIWFLIPARAGSKAIPKKNIRLLNGKPLIRYVLETVRKVSDKERVIVSTDDEEVKGIVNDFAVIHHRSDKFADDKSTLDDVALEVVNFLMKEHNASKDDVLVTVQPTSPFLKSETLVNAIEKFENKNIETVLTVVDDRHLRWTIENEVPQPLYETRVNRQQMNPIYAETGGIIASTINTIIKKKTRIGKKAALLEIDYKQGLDIDTYEDWARAEFWCNRIRIFIRVDGSRELGFGHLYRALALAQNLTAHELCFITRSEDDYKLGLDFLKTHNYPILEISNEDELFEKIDGYQPDIIINDILDTDQHYIEQLKQRGLFVVNFEDLGSGNKKADLVINDLYPDLYPQKNHWYGIENAILNPNFEYESPNGEPAKEVNEILVAYGGTDPNNLTLKALKALEHISFQKKISVVLGPGYLMQSDIEEIINKSEAEVQLLRDVKNMAQIMKKADLALTSAGRTVTELMSLGIPTITVCQNMREMRHNHASSTFGIVNLGMGTSVDPVVLADHIKLYMDEVELRRDMYHRMIEATKERSNAKIVKRIINNYKRTLKKN